MPTLPELFAQLAAALEPHLRAAALAAFQALAGAVDEATLADAIARAGGDRARLVLVIDTLLAPAITDAAFTPLRDALRSALVAGGETMAGSITGILAAAPPPTPPTGAASVGGPVPPAGDTVRITFNAVNPRVLDAVRASEFELFPKLADDVRAGARQLIADGLADGRGPAEIARQIRPMLGLTEYQAGLVANRRRELTSGKAADVRSYLDKALRDKRFDKTVAKVADGVVLTPEQVDRIADGYARGLLASNADTLARTESINALKRSQLGGWESAIESGAVGRGDLVKTWHATPDDRTRPAHMAANGLTVGFDEDFPVDGGCAMPGLASGVYNCRCAALIRPKWVHALSQSLAAEAA